MSYRLRLATGDDVLRIAPQLREKDQLEIEVVSGGMSPEAALLAALKAPGEVLIAETAADHQPILICGVCPTHPGLAAAIWMVGTPLLERHALASVRDGLRLIERWNQVHPLLWNQALATNDLHIRWLALLGFSFLRRFDFRGFPFIELAKLKDTSLCALTR